MDKYITFSQALEGYSLYAEARRLSPRTIADYTNTFRKFKLFLAPDDPSLAAITADAIRRFLASQNGLSKKTLSNYHTGLAALWTWAVKEGTPSGGGVRLLTEILRCPTCSGSLVRNNQLLHCIESGHSFRVADDGVIELAVK